LVVGVGVGGFFAKVKIDAANHHVHGGELPSGVVVFLAVNGDIANAALMLANEVLRLHNKAAAAHRRVVDAAFEGFEHLHNQANDGFGGKLAAIFSFGQGKLAEKVFVDMTENVFAA
jgi:hypothetical protein